MIFKEYGIKSGQLEITEALYMQVWSKSLTRYICFLTIKLN